MVYVGITTQAGLAASGLYVLVQTKVGLNWGVPIISHGIFLFQLLDAYYRLTTREPLLVGWIIFVGNIFVCSIVLFVLGLMEITLLYLPQMLLVSLASCGGIYRAVRAERRKLEEQYKHSLVSRSSPAVPQQVV